jgi:hypothetical protein
MIRSDKRTKHKTVVQPGRKVAVTEPTYVGGNHVFDSLACHTLISPERLLSIVELFLYFYQYTHVQASGQTTFRCCELECFEVIVTEADRGIGYGTISTA